MRPFRSTCVPEDGSCRPLTWILRSRYVINDYTEAKLVEWAQRKGWGGKLYASDKGKHPDVYLPRSEEGQLFVRKWKEGLVE